MEDYKITDVNVAANGKDNTFLTCPYAEAKSQIMSYTECNEICPIVEGYKCKRWDICGVAKRKLKQEEK